MAFCFSNDVSEMTLVIRQKNRDAKKSDQYEFFLLPFECLHRDYKWATSIINMEQSGTSGETYYTHEYHAPLYYG